MVMKTQIISIYHNRSFLKLSVKKMIRSLHKLDPFNQLLKIEMVNVLKDRKIERQRKRKKNIEYFTKIYIRRKNMLELERKSQELKE